MELRKLIEAILYSADRPLCTHEITQLVRKGGPENFTDFAKLQEQDVAEILESIKGSSVGQSMILQEIAGGWRFGTSPEFAPWIRTLCEDLGKLKFPRLSQASLETLAVIAYRQPISRAEIESIRGVGAGGVLETLIEREVVRVAGRADVPGRPLLYETTPFFLEHFGLRSLDELPNVDELKRVKLPEAHTVSPEQQPELIHEPTETTSPN